MHARSIDRNNMLRAGASLAFVATIVAGLAGCRSLRIGDGPTPCNQIFSAKRCLVMTDFAALQVGVTRADVVAIDVVPEPTVNAPPGVLMVRSGGPDVHARITLRDGSTHTVSMGCMGIPNQITCFDDPHLSIGGMQMGGYHDLPCPGEPPDGCATPLPDAAPDANAAATAIRIARLDIRIDHVGDYHIVLGEARLPNGIVTEESAELVDDRPADITILSGGVGLGVRSLEADGRPFTNVYEHGWREGTERVEAFLAFHVDHFDPGATLSVAGIVVR